MAIRYTEIMKTQIESILARVFTKVNLCLEADQGRSVHGGGRSDVDWVGANQFEARSKGAENGHEAHDLFDVTSFLDGV